MLLRISLAAAVVKKEILVVVSDRVYGGLLLDIRGLDKRKRWRKETVPLVQLPGLSGFIVGLY